MGRKGGSKLGPIDTTGCTKALQMHNRPAMDPRAPGLVSVHEFGFGTPDCGAHLDQSGQGIRGYQEPQRR